MSNLLDNTTPFELAGFMVDPAAGTLVRGEQEIQLQPKVMQLLLCLAEHHGQIVSKEYLLEHVWSGTFVVDGALRRCVFLLRKALADPERDESVLETLPRRGYRLSVAPQAVGQAASNDGQSEPQTVQPVVTERSFEGEAYRGLQVFESRHADRFFGRRAAIDQVLGALDAQVQGGHGFCLILGPSGSGKSSLAMAGVVPALMARHGEREALACATFKLSDSPTDPLERFATCLIGAIDGDDVDERASRLAQQLHDDDEEAAVSTILKRLQPKEDGPRKQLLLVFDQFEELLTDDTDESLRATFLSVLYPLVRSGGVWLLATMRSEFYPQFVAIEALRFMRADYGQVDLNFPGAAEITDIVRKPAELAGLTFDLDDKSRRLDQIIIDDATAQKNSLPLLQFVLRELELKSSDNVLRVADYHALGTLEGCLSEHADRVFDGLPEAARDALPVVLERMVSADPRNAGRVLKRTVALSEFRDHPGALELVQAFIDARLITTFIDKVSGAPAAQFAHEAVLDNWGRGRDWVSANYADIRFRTWINDLATRWHDDQRANQYLLNDGKSLVEARRLVAAQVGLAPAAADFVAASHRRASMRDIVRGAVTVTLAGLTILAMFMWRSAENSRVLAEASARRVEATNDLMLSIFESADTGNSKDGQLSAFDVMEKARERMADQFAKAEPVDQAAMLSKLAEIYVLMGKFKIADELLGNAEALLPDIEDKHPDVAAKVLLELGGLRRTQEDLDDSERYLVRALSLAQRADDALNTAHVLNLQGLLARMRGDHKEEVRLNALAQSVLETEPSRFATNRLSASLIANLATARMNLGDLEAADEGFVEALALRRELGLHKTAGTTDLLANRGALAFRQARFDEAAAHFSQAIEVRTQLHGENHPKLVSYEVNRSWSQLQLKQYSAARESAKAGLRVIANDDSGHGASVTALLHAYFAIASYASDASVESSRLSDAQEQVAVLSNMVGDSAPIVRSLDLAVIGLALKNEPSPESTQAAALCRRLALAANRLPAKEDWTLPVQAKAASQLKGCDAVG